MMMQCRAGMGKDYYAVHQELLRRCINRINIVMLESVITEQLCFSNTCVSAKLPSL